MSLAYQKIGSGEAIIFLHGWLQSKNYWRPYIDPLSKNHTLYLVDLPGFGESQLKDSAMSLKDYVTSLHQFLSQQRLNHAIFVGHSFGGRVALSYALKYPKDVKKLVLYSVSISYFTGVRYFLFLLFHLLIYSKLLKTFLATHNQKSYTFALEKIRVPLLFILGESDPLLPITVTHRIQKLLPNAQIVIIPRGGHFSHRNNSKSFLKTLQNFLW